MTQNLTVRFPANFPSTVSGRGGIGVEKENGEWIVFADFGSLEEIFAAGLIDPTDKQIWVFDPVTEEYSVMTLAGLGDALFKATSTTSLAVGTGSKTFTTQSGKGFAVGSFVLATSDADPADYMLGQVTAYSGTSLTVNVTVPGGSGTDADWTLRASSPAGPAGAAGVAGPGYAATSVSSQTIGSSGTKTFTVASGLAYTAGARVRAADAGAPSANWMEGVVTSYSGTTLAFTADKSLGSGTLTSWNINVAGQPGTNGAGSGDMLAANNLSDVANVATAFSNIKQAASDTATGVVELATTAETITGTDTARATTPADVDAALGVHLGFAMRNGKIVATVAASALTIAIKTLAGADPSATDPVRVTFRDSTASDGSLTTLKITAATSLVISSGSTLGVSNNTPFRVWVVGFNDAGTFRLGAINCRTSAQIVPLREYLLKSSTAEGGAGAADTAGTIYTGTAVSSKAFRILGFLTWNAGLATAGTWSAAPDVIQLFGVGVPAPGEKVQSARATTASTSTNTTTSYADSNLSLTMDVTSAANPVEVHVDGSGAIDDNSTFGFWAITRGGTVLEYSRTGFTTAGGLSIFPIAISASDFPGAAGSTTWKVRTKSGSAGNEVYFAMTGGGGDAGASMTALEIMG